MSEYLDWNDLLEDDEAGEASVSPAFPEQKDEKALADLLQMDQISDELKELITQHQALEQEMDQLLGRSEPEEKSWDSIRFPMPVHTAESRLRDRKNLHAERLLAEKKKKQLESIKLQRKNEEKQLHQAKELKKRRLLLEKAELHKKQKRQMVLDELKRLRLCERQIAKRSHEQKLMEEQQQREQYKQIARQRELAESKRLKAQKELALKTALLRKKELSDYLERDAIKKEQQHKERSVLDELAAKQQQTQDRILQKQKETRSFELQEQKRQARALQRQVERRNEQARWGL